MITHTQFYADTGQDTFGDYHHSSVDLGQLYIPGRWFMAQHDCLLCSGTSAEVHVLPAYVLLSSADHMHSHTETDSTEED